MLRDKETHNFDDEDWLKIYKSIDQSFVVDDGDDDMTDVLV